MKKEKTVYVVCLKDKGRNDFLYVCESRGTALYKKIMYERQHDCSVDIFEETLYV